MEGHEGGVGGSERKKKRVAARPQRGRRLGRQGVNGRGRGRGRGCEGNSAKKKECGKKKERIKGIRVIWSVY